MNVKTCVSHEEKDECTTTNNSSTVVPPPPTQAQQSTPQAGNKTTLRNQGSASPSTPQGSKTPSSSSGTPSTPRRPKFRNISEIYQQDEADSNAGINSLFALFCHVDDPIHFEDAVKEDKWVAEMNEEIEAIEKNDTWELVDLPQGK